MGLFSDALIARIQAIDSKIIVFAMMRNEIVRLGSWFKHYRAIGCRDFVVIDNGSQDETFEALKSQEGTITLQTFAPWSEANFGVDWLNEFRALVAPDKWVLFADADELLIYPGWPDVTLAQLVDEIDTAGCDALWAFMLDMYPGGPIEPVVPPPGIDMFEAAPCFDSEYIFFYPQKKPWEPEHPGLTILGGPRLRSLTNMQREVKTTWFDRFFRGQLDRLLPFTPEFLYPWMFRVFPQPPPALFKSPLAQAGAAARYIDAHRMSGVKYYEKNGLLCHFKFLGDFSKRVQEEVQRKQHYRGGAEYFRYQELLKKHGVLDFCYAKTLRFESARQMQELGLLGAPPLKNPAIR